jgi:hypothetical protein
LPCRRDDGGEVLFPAVLHHPTDGVFEHLTDRARRKMTELVPHELCAVIVIGTVEKVDVRWTTVTAKGLAAPRAPRRPARSL